MTKGSRLTSEEVKAELLSLLLAFDEIAKRKGIAYSLAYGTLLGAVRHEGFIPWDDDVDVVVPRPDYERLVEYARSGGGIAGYCFTGYEVDGFPMPFLKLVNPRIRVRDCATKERIRLDLWIDVFPLDGCLADPVEQSRTDRVAHYCKAVIKTSNYRFWGAGKGRLNRLEKMATMPFVELLGLGTKANERLIRMAKEGPAYDDAQYVANVVWGPYRMGEILDKSLFQSTCTVVFEGHELPALGGWDAYLSCIYGDYMRLPPEDQRMAHGIEAWWRDEASTDASQ